MNYRGQVTISIEILTDVKAQRGVETCVVLAILRYHSLNQFPVTSLD
jgi:hypothetical protein